MLNVKSDLRTALADILPLHYELFPDKVTLPCISYFESNNSVYKNGLTLGYSNISITLKVWTSTVESTDSYSQQVDTVMRNLGYKRVSATELVENQNTIVKILVYNGLGKEEFN